MLVEFLWRAGDRFDAKCRQALFHVREANDLDGLAIEHRDELSRRSGWDDKTPPVLTLDVRIAGLGHGGYIGQRLQPCLAGSRKRAHLALLDQRHGRRRRGEANRRVTRDHRADRQIRAVEWYMHKV